MGVWDGTCVVVPVYRLLHAVGGLLVGGLFCGVWVLCENWIVDASILFFCKFDFSAVFLLWLFLVVCVLCCKGAWWMPWHDRPMKDVRGCDRPRGAAN